MTVQGVFYVVLAAILTFTSNLLLRAGVLRAGGITLTISTILSDLVHLLRQPLAVIGVICYGLAALVWFRVISTENLNSSYPVLVGLTFTLVTAGATLLFHEPLNWQKCLGLVLIFAGILVVAQS
mgnify:CR=1 FL=1